MAIDIDDLSSIAIAILDCIKIEEQQESYNAIQDKLNELSQIKFEGNASIQNHFIQNIARLRRARDKMTLKFKSFDPIAQLAWEALAEKLDLRIESLIKSKRIHAMNQ